jgi:hypothetical protein
MRKWRAEMKMYDYDSKPRWIRDKLKEDEEWRP